MGRPLTMLAVPWSYLIISVAILLAVRRSLKEANHYIYMKLGNRRNSISLTNGNEKEKLPVAKIGVRHCARGRIKPIDDRFEEK
eukprot:scaffold589187_cov24-Prasinocladus_malaysianus.AAC.1